MRTAALLLAVALATSSTASANGVTVSARIDNTIYEESGTLSNGAGTWFFVGNNNQGNARRALVSFDVAAAVPAGSTINSVQLVLFMSMTIVGAQTIEVHNVLSNWGEGISDTSGGEGTGTAATPGDATWTNTLYPSTLWTTPGGDFAATTSASLSVSGNGAYTWLSTPALVADVQSWLNTPSSNFGWILKATNEATTSAKRFSSRENTVPSQRPKLVIDFTPPPPAQPYCFGDGSGTACPCANSGAAGNGCGHSIDPNGGNLAFSGTPSLAADTFVLLGSGMPSSSALYFQGTAQVNAGLGAPFGDGLRCVGGSVIRLGLETNVAGVSQYPSGVEAPVSIRGAIPGAGSVRYYQCWFRNAAAFCTPATFNLTNGMAVTWGA